MDEAYTNGTFSFHYVDVTVPAGYYDAAAGLNGSALRVALHNIIKAHTSLTYTFTATEGSHSGTSQAGDSGPDASGKCRLDRRTDATP